MKFQNCKVIGADVDPAAYHRQDAQRGSPEFAMSPSAIKAFLQNPRRWVLGYNSPDSASKAWGNVMDTMVTSPDTFHDRYVVRPETYAAPADHDKVKKGEITAGAPLAWNSNAKVCKEWDKANLRGREPISNEDYTAATEAYNRLLADETIGRIIAESARQVLVVGEVVINGVVIPVRCLIDLAPSADGEFPSCLGDLKTSRNASRRSFGRFAYEMGYHIQGAFNLDLFNAATGQQRDTWLMVVQESYRPFETARHILSQRYLNLGRMQYAAALERYAQCLSLPRMQWPGYNDHPEAVQGWSTLEPEAWMENVETFAQPIAEDEQEPETADVVP